MICAHAVSVTLKKTPGVQSVDVSLNKGVATVKLSPGNTIHIDDLWEGVRKNGFTPKDTTVVVRGEVTAVNGRPHLKVSGTNQTYELQFGTPAELLKHVGETVVIDGVMTPAKDSKAVLPIRVKGIR